MSTQPVAVRSGPLTAELRGSELREVRVAGLLALDAVYAAVRDAGWGTVPGQLERFEVADQEDGFLARFAMRHTSAEVDLRWTGQVHGRDGVVSFGFEGTALRDFVANRIGFCLLHPLRLKGQGIEARTPQGASTGRFPDAISPHQPFVELTGLRYDLGRGASLDIGLDGDLFEMEDHRNWTDAGWKTYCRPLRLPIPFEMPAGRTIRQTVTLRPQVSRGASRTPAGRSSPAVTVRDRVVGRLPALGLMASPAGGTAGADAVAQLRPSYLYAELGPDRPVAALAAAVEQAAAAGTRLDLALVGARADDALQAVADEAGRGRIGRVAVFDRETSTTPPGAAASVRAALGSGTPRVAVGGGSRAFFAELNRARLPLDELDFVTYGICPQVHHSDDRSIVDTLAAQPDTVRDARRIAAGRPVVAGPVSLRMRFNPYTRGAGPIPGPDPRQAADFTAAWTVGALAALSGADSVTLFEATGERGVVGVDGEQARPFPVWHVLAALAAFQRAELLEVHCSDLTDRPTLAGLGVRDGPESLLLLADLTGDGQVVQVHGMVDCAATALGGGQALDPHRVALAPYGVAAVHGGAGILYDRLRIGGRE